MWRIYESAEVYIIICSLFVDINVRITFIWDDNTCLLETEIDKYDGKVKKDSVVSPTTEEDRFLFEAIEGSRKWVSSWKSSYENKGAMRDWNKK